MFVKRQYLNGLIGRKPIEDVGIELLVWQKVVIRQGVNSQEKTQILNRRIIATARMAYNIIHRRSCCSRNFFFYYFYDHKLYFAEM